MTFRPVELQVTTNFSFLQGGSRPHELAAQAAALGYEAIGVTDRNTLAGIVRAHVAAKEIGIPLVVGARVEVAFEDSGKVAEWQSGKVRNGAW